MQSGKEGGNGQQQLPSRSPAVSRRGAGAAGAQTPAPPLAACVTLNMLLSLSMPLSFCVQSGGGN